MSLNTQFFNVCWQRGRCQVDWRAVRWHFVECCARPADLVNVWDEPLRSKYRTIVSWFYDSRTRDSSVASCASAPPQCGSLSHQPQRRHPSRSSQPRWSSHGHVKRLPRSFPTAYNGDSLRGTVTFVGGSVSLKQPKGNRFLFWWCRNHITGACRCFKPSTFGAQLCRQLTLASAMDG